MSKKITIQIKSRWVIDNVLFEYESEDNTMKKTVETAVKRGAYLRDAYLRGAVLRGADLGGAVLRGADLRGADLGGAYLRGAYLGDADLRGAVLRDAKGADLAIAMTRILPEGDIIGYKKCKDNEIVKLLIPKDAKRSHAFGRKCRAEFAKVLEITKDNRQFKTAISGWDGSFTYKVGDVVKPVEPFSEDWQNECESGIHFYITKLEAENN